MIYDKYSIFVDFGNGFEQVTPINNDLLFSWEKDKDWGFYRKKIETSLDFCKEDYQKFLALELSCDRCDKIPIQITACDDELVYEGYFNLNKGIWDRDRCNLKITPIVQDEYTCLFENWNIKRNILGLFPKTETSSFIGEIQCQECVEGTNNAFQSFQTYGADCLPTNEGWTIVKNEFIAVTQVSQSPPTYTAVTIRTKYCREFVAGTTVPIGSGWLPVSGGFARPLQTQFDPNNSFFDINVVVSFTVSGYDVENENTYDYDNGVDLETVFESLLVDCDLDICSDFLNINPDQTAPSNTPYQCASSDLTNLILYQKTDIKNANAFQNATRANLSLKELIEILSVLNIEWWVENGKFRIEHISYKEALSQNGLDVLMDFPECLKGLHQYQYESSEIPQFERFSWMDSVSAYFQGEDIVYDSSCVDTEAEETYNFNKVTTDVNYINSNPDQISNEGFLLMSTTEYQGGVYMNDSNRPLSFIQIHECYWRHGRPQFNGTMNDESTCFETAKRIKSQNGIEFPLCCSDFVSFDPNLLINTQIGWGEIVSAKYSAKTGYLTVDLLHEQEKCC